MTHKKIFSTVASITTILLAASANANSLNVKNELDNTIKVTVEPSDGSVFSNNNETKFEVNSGDTKSANLSKELLGNKETFSVTGSSTKTFSMPSINNKCGPLSIKKNYNIVFTEGKGVKGVICVVTKESDTAQ